MPAKMRVRWRLRNNPIGLRPLLTALILLGLIAGGSVQAELVRFEIQSREPLAEGLSFGDAGPYERITGRAIHELDPGLRQNQAIVDLALAPRNDRGRVEFYSDIFILAPLDLSRARGSLLYDVNNRGNKLALRFFNQSGGGNDPRSVSDCGDGFLMRQGFIVVWSGWDGELLPDPQRLRLYPPVISGNDQPVTGPVRCEIVPTENNTRQIVVNWAGHGSHRPVPSLIEKATLTHRIRPGDPRVIIPRDQWTLHVTEFDSPSQGQLPKVEIEVPAGLQKGHLYEVIYQAQDPQVHGVCFAGVRDLIAALRTGSGEKNPLLLEGRPAVRRAHAFGVSQSGRFLREFLYSGFNEDEAGQKVFDGLIPHVSGSGMGSFNHRFAQPTRHATQHDHADYPPDRFPFTYGESTDPLSGRTDSLLRRAIATKTVPFVLHTQSAAEYWTRAGSLSHTDPLGREDAAIPDNVRIYLFGGTQHGPAGYPPARGDGQHLANPADYRPFLRALLIALDEAARSGKALPPSVYPTIREGTLVDWTQEATGFPKIPGVTWPQVIRQPELLDFGPRWLSQGIVDRQPPVARGKYIVRVPRCDDDGNERACLSPPEVIVPLGTYTGWNLRSASAGAEDQLLSLTGSFLPFAKTRAEREAGGDPRRSLQERYADAGDYARRLEECCRDLSARGYLLADDIPELVARHRERAASAMAQTASGAD
jgi:hypothetical protein